jgi:quercetin dioxygenase-like cupin family protein
MTRITAFTALVYLVFGTFSTGFTLASSHEDPSAAEASSRPKLENLLKTELGLFEGGEVIVSRVTIPPHTSLPKHWHPGEEFAYILEGSCYLWQHGEEEIPYEAGDVLKVPFKQVHTAITRDDGATILVFRVHEAGKPERVLVE